MENESNKKFKVVPCKYCKRGRMKVQSSGIVGSQIVADKCVYCNGRGYIREEIKGSNI